MTIALLQAHLPDAASTVMDGAAASGWVIAFTSAAQFLLTVGILLWRMSGLIEQKAAHANQMLADHEKDDLASFNKLSLAVTMSGDEIRKELAMIATSLRANIMTVQADLTDKINKVELETSRQFLPKAAVYQLLSDLKEQAKDDSTEIKEWLKRLESKIDQRGA